jgi:hypothetical protein
MQPQISKVPKQRAFCRKNHNLRLSAAPVWDSAWYDLDKRAFALHVCPAHRSLVIIYRSWYLGIAADSTGLLSIRIECTNGNRHTSERTNCNGGLLRTASLRWCCLQGKGIKLGMHIVHLSVEVEAHELLLVSMIFASVYFEDRIFATERWWFFMLRLKWCSVCDEVMHRVLAAYDHRDQGCVLQPEHINTAYADTICSTAYAVHSSVHRVRLGS